MATINLAGALTEIETILTLIQQLEGLIKPLVPPAPKGPRMVAAGVNAMALSSSDSATVAAVMTKTKAAMDDLCACLEEKYE